MSFTEKIRAYRISLAQLATEKSLALIVIANLVGGIAANVFISINATQRATWDATSQIIWPYIMPLALAALLIGILYHMYTGTKE